MSEWRQVELSSVARVVNHRVEPNSQPPDMIYVGLEHMGTGLSRITDTGKVADVSSLVSRFRSGDTLFGRLRPYLRKVALAECGGVCSPEILVLRPDTDEIVPGYLHLVASSASAIDHAVAASAGSRMPRTAAADLVAFTFRLPSMDEQRRIVDLIGALDAHIVAMAEELVAARVTLAATLDRLVDAADGPTRLLGELVSISSGPSWSAADESHEPSPAARRVIKITNTRANSVVDLSEHTYVSGLPDATSELDDTSLIIIRTNGNRARIGNVYRPPDEVTGAAVSAFQFIAKAESEAGRDFLFSILRAPSLQSRMSQQASGSTGLGNLSIRWLKGLRIPWPDADVRSAHVSQCASIDLVIESASAELADLRCVRSAALGALLVGRLDIPESYDVLMESA